MKKFFSFFVCLTLLLTFPPSVSAIGGNPLTDAFSVQYSPMTDAAAYEKLNSLPLAPGGGGALPQLSGKTYEIKNGQSLALSLNFDEQGAGVSFSALLPPPAFSTTPRQEAFTSEYAGLASGDYVLVGFRKPGSARAWAVVLNLKTGVAAAYEMFFQQIGAWYPAREAQRNVYLGRAEGVGDPAKLPTATNRLTGKAVLWTNDLGRFYTNYGTRSWSAFYPLGQPEGLAGSWTAPSDYFDFHDARHFLYSRTETYYSGATLVELIDLYLVSQIGLKIGFDADDAPIFRLYGGTGEILGSYAAYGGFAQAEYPTGGFGRYPYIPSSGKLTREAVVAAMESAGSWSGAFGGPGKEEKMYPLSDKLDGEEFSLVFDDGLALEYQFTGVNELKFREAGAQDWKTGRYEAFEVDANLIFFTHAIDDRFPDKIYLNVVDFDNGLATCMNSQILVDVATPRMCVPSFHFGVLAMDGITPVSGRHGFSEGLLGTSFTWTYNDSVVSQHYYATPDSLYYGIMGQDGETFLMWSCDAWYVKFRENVYLISWLESFGSGQNDSKVFNLNNMHDAGVCYGIPDGNAPFEYNTYGSEARHAGTVDVSSIYGNVEQPYPVTYSMAYELNGGTGAAITDDRLYASGASVTVKGIGAASRAGYSFTGWNTAQNGSGAAYKPGDDFTIRTDATLFAPWSRRADASNGGGSGGSSGGASAASQQPQAPAEAPPVQATSGGAVVEDAPTPLAAFPDGSAISDWAKPFIEKLAALGVISGRADGSLAPKSPVTRAEFTKMAVLALGIKAEGAPLAFDDVNTGQWFKEYVDAASSRGVANGVSEKLFSPDSNITRQDICAMAYRALSRLGVDPPSERGAAFPDDGSIAGYAKDAVYALRQMGIVSGRETGAFDPSAPATREETAKIICGVLDYMASRPASTDGAEAPAR